MRLTRILFLLLLALAAPAAAQAPPPAQLDHLAQVLRDPARRAELLRLIEALASTERALAQPGEAAPAAAAPPAAATQPAAAEADDNLFTPTTLGGRLLVHLGERIEQFADLVMATAHGMTDLSALWAGLTALGRSPVQQARLGNALLHLAGLGLAGLLLEALAARLLRRLSRRLERAAPPDGNAWTWLRRVPLVLGRLGLDLLPLALLGGTVMLGLGLARPRMPTQLVVLMTLNLYLAARVGLALARMLLSPAAGHLRLLPCSDANAAWLIIWLRRLLVVGLGSYALAELTALVGMPARTHAAVLRLGLLLLTLMLARMIRQQRDAVARVLRPPPLRAEDGIDQTHRLLRALRARLAAHWHLLAMGWLLAGWAVAGMGVESGFSRMLNGSAQTLGLVAAAKLLDEAMHWLLRRLLHPSAAAARQAPWLAPFARRYVPPFRVAWTLALLATTLVLLAEAWGYPSLAWFAPGQPGYRLLGTALSIGFTALLGLLVWEAANSAIERQLTRQLPTGRKAQGSMRLRTLLPVLRAFLATGVVAFILFNVLQELGVNIGPLIAGASVVGLAIGVGSQKLVQDVITGIFLLVEDSVAVGDVVTLGDRTGVVEHLTIRSIRLRASDGSVHWVPFSAVSTVTNMTRDYGYAVVDVTLGYQQEPDKVTAALRRIAQAMQADPAWHDRMPGEVEEPALERMTDTGMVFRLRARTTPGEHWAVARELNRRCRMELEAAGVELPAGANGMKVETPANPPPGPGPAR